jgi:hypothetical protein
MPSSQPSLIFTKGTMAGHPSVKKRQKELQRKERQAEKLAKRDERRIKRPDEPSGDGDVPVRDDLPPGLTPDMLEAPPPPMPDAPLPHVPGAVRTAATGRR